ncbi:unnamed protein product [Callosobruchus maculatus]|uniref:Uncharacterized protein n=1 Tax=Callosobruchus maculatus TaxID=64391 RepID=A0A653DB36_CALMS|nr:unnamed protein product [Callosobruchus maculatus]
MLQIKPTRNNMLPPDPVYTMKSDMGYIHHLNFFQGSTSQLLAATEKGLVYFWDLNTHRASCKKEMGESIQAVHSYTDRIITQEKSGIIKLWSTEDFKMINSYEYCGGYCKSVTIDDILVVPQEKGVDLVDKKTFKKTKTLVSDRKNSGHLMALQMVNLENGTYILAAFESGDVILWDIVSEKICGYSRLQEQLTTLTFDSTMGRGVCGGASNKMQVFAIDKSFNITLKCEIILGNEGCSIEDTGSRRLGW